MTSLAGFTNEPIDPEEIPALEQHGFQPLESAHLRLQQAGWGVVAVVMLVVAGAIAIGTDAPTLVPLLIGCGGVALSILGVVLEQLAFAQRGWLLREHDISSRQGLVGRNTTTAPFVRVQHVTVNRGALERLTGIARLSVFTAGAGSADLVIPGLSAETAEQMRETVLLRSTNAKSAGTGGTGGTDGADDQLAHEVGNGSA